MREHAAAPSNLVRSKLYPCLREYPLSVSICSERMCEAGGLTFKQPCPVQGRLSLLTSDQNHQLPVACSSAYRCYLMACARLPKHRLLVVNDAEHGAYQAGTLAACCSFLSLPHRSSSRTAAAACL